MEKNTPQKPGNRTHMINGDFIKFHTIFPDKSEIIEEYGLYSEEFVSRRVKKLSMTGKEEWTTEIGEEPRLKGADEFLIKENDNNPIFIRKDTPSDFQWRIRNLNSSKDNFSVDCDKEKNQIIIRTKNKKYFKRFNIPDWMRGNIPWDDSLLKINYMNNTLVISYTKPAIIVKAEQELLSEIRRIRNEVKTNPEKKYDTDCKNQ